MFEEFKLKMTSHTIDTWKVSLVNAAVLMLCLLSAVAIALFSQEALADFFTVSLFTLWLMLVVEVSLLGYLQFYRNIPLFARFAILGLIAICNAWALMAVLIGLVTQ